MTTNEIIGLIAQGNLYPFYNGRQWRRLSHEVMREQHYECQLCRARGRHRRARLVHHVNELRQRPDLAYEMFYVDGSGQLQRNLLALCQECHEAQHPDRLKRQEGNEKKFINEERW